MSHAPDEETVYRYSVFGARGTVTLSHDSVHLKTLTFNGSWEKTIPLETLSPYYGKLDLKSTMYYFSWFFVVFCVWMGGYGIIWGLMAVPQKLLSIALLLVGIPTAIYLYRKRKCAWIIFQSSSPANGVHYTRQGPDEQKCDEFTQLLVERIHASSEADKSNTTISIKS